MRSTVRRLSWIVGALVATAAVEWTEPGSLVHKLLFVVVAGLVGVIVYEAARRWLP
jgi:hypothetical protein